MHLININKTKIYNKKLSSLQLIILSLLAALAIIFTEGTKQKAPHPNKDKMITAAKTMESAAEFIKSYRIKNNIEINFKNNHAGSGFIGMEFSPITTTLGNFNAKLTSTNPDFAALYIKWFYKLGLKKGDNIVIHTSGSFPALGIASIIASEAYELNPIIISSIGASSFGANIPNLTYWDIENKLYQEKIIFHKTIYATMGGQNDNGSSFWEGGITIARNAAKRNLLKLNIPNNLKDAIEEKLNLITSYNNIKLFINIGGNQSALGYAPCSMQLEYGLAENIIAFEEKECFGVLHNINQMNIPYIHMLNINNIALENGISLVTNTNKNIGLADVYFVIKKSKYLSAIFLGMITLLAISFHVYNKRKFNKNYQLSENSSTNITMFV